VGAILTSWWLLGRPGLGMEIFPTVDAGQFQIRLRGPTGARIERTEELTLEALAGIEEAVGAENVEITICYVGTPPPSYPINNVYLWTSGPEEAVIRVSLKRGSGVRVEDSKARLRGKLKERLEGWLRRKLLAEGLTAARVDERVGALRLSFE